MCAYRHSYNTKALPADYEFVGLTEISGYLRANVCYVCVCKEGEGVIVKYRGREVRVQREKKGDMMSRFVTACTLQSLFGIMRVIRVIRRVVLL